MGGGEDGAERIKGLEDTGQVGMKQIQEQREKVCTPKCPEESSDLSTEVGLVKCPIWQGGPCQAWNASAIMTMPSGNDRDPPTEI